MAYSNINKDKAQVKLTQKLKRTVIVVILVILTVSAWTNIWQQATTLNEARNRNRQALDKINGLESGNKKLIKEIEDATGSAFEQRKVREYLGLGTDRDHWLLTDLGVSQTAAMTGIPDSGTKTVLMQWWGLFAK